MRFGGSESRAPDMFETGSTGQKQIARQSAAYTLGGATGL